MVALTADANRTEKEGRLQAVPVLAGAVIYKGALVKTTAAGYLAPASAEASAKAAGVAYESVDNTDGGSGDVSVRVEMKRAFEVAGAGFTQADMFKPVYASDDNTVSTTQGANEQEFGKIIEVFSATKVLVSLNLDRA